MSEETRINSKVWKKIQAGQDWSDLDTWLGLGIALTILGFMLVAHYFSWVGPYDWN